MSANTNNNPLTAYALTVKAAYTASKGILPIASHAYKALEGQYAGETLTPEALSNLTAFNARVDEAIATLTAIGKPIGASSLYNMLDGRTCYGQKLFKAAVSLKNSKAIAAYLTLRQLVRGNAPRNSISKAGNAYTAQHGKFSQPIPAAAMTPENTTTSAKRNGNVGKPRDLTGKNSRKRNGKLTSFTADIMGMAYAGNW